MVGQKWQGPHGAKVRTGGRPGVLLPAETLGFGVVPMDTR